MRRMLQPVLTVIRWCICHCELGRRFTKFYKTTLDTRRRKKACRRLQRYGWDILSRVGAALDETDSGYFVDYGTLLGLIREGSFIKHDDDIDFSLPWGKLTPQALLNIMLQNGFTFMRAFLWRGQITELSFLWKKVEVDFFYILNDDEGKRFSLEYDCFTTEDGVHVAKKITRVDKPDCVESKIVKINGENIYVPVVESEFLEYSYGTDWRIPVKGFKGMVRSVRLDGSTRMFVTLNDFKQYLSDQL